MNKNQTVMADDVAKRKKIRSAHRGAATRLINKVNEQLNEEGFNCTKEKAWLMQQVCNAKEKIETLKALDDNFVSAIVENDTDCDAEELELTIAEGDTLRADLQGIISRIQELYLPKHENDGAIPVPAVLPPFHSYSNQSTVKCMAKLPKLTLTKFRGKLQQWQEFWDSFESTVHLNESLADVDKFKYLKMQLEGPALLTIGGFALTSANYYAAIELLKRRYGKQDIIQRAHVNDLLNLIPISHDENTADLRKFYDAAETHFRGLKALGVQENVYAGIVVPALIQKLPSAFRLTITRGHQDFMSWSMEKLLEQVRCEIELREEHQLSSTTTMPSEEQGQCSASALLSANEQLNCVYCLGKHKPEKCQRVILPSARKNILVRYARCFRCLKKNHRAFECNAKTRVCLKCRGAHHVSICEAQTEQNRKVSGPFRQSQERGDSSNTESSSNHVAPGYTESFHTGSGTRVALQTAQGIISANNASLPFRTRVLFDAGSHRSFITSSAASRAKLPVVRKEWLCINAFGQRDQKGALRDVVEFQINAVKGDRSIIMQAFVVPEISNIPNEHVELARDQFSHLKGLWFSDVNMKDDRLEIGILVGADFLWQFQNGRVIRGREEEPVAIETELGWVLSGPLKCNGDFADRNAVQANLIVQNQSLGEPDRLENELKKLWDLETLGIRETQGVQEEFLDNISFNGDRYSVKLPWKVSHRSLPTNYENSAARLHNTLRKLKKEPEVLDEYERVIKGQAKLGVIETVHNLEEGDKVHYLPHRAVVRRKVDTSTKVRVVYDASSKAGKKGVSLNDCLHVGPSLNPLLFDVLLRFRIYRVALVADIEKAFLNIAVDKEDRDCLRFLWPENPRENGSPIKVYRFCRVVFGLNCSPFLLNGTLRHHLMKYQVSDPTFVDRMINSFYVDDLVTGSDNPDEAFKLYLTAKERLAQGGFNLRKWLTNHKTLMGKLERNEENECIDSQVEQTFAKANLGVVDDGKSHKVLGIPWDSNSDVLGFDFQHVYEKAEQLKATKRNILSVLACLFDPLGVVSPLTVSARIFFQTLCRKSELGWDEELTTGLKKHWEDWVKSLKQARRIDVSRNVLNATNKVQLHGFADASCKAYCAVVYLVHEDGEERKVRLLCSKTRVSPLKEITIPRLELMAALILARLVSNVKKALGTLIEVEKENCWSDSITVLYWLANKREWKQFVKHRVGEILQLTQDGQWKYCPGLQNPADIGSRGSLASELKTSELWWNGPQWLSGPEKNWPVSIVQKTPEGAEEEKTTISMVVNAREKRDVSNVIDIERFSNSMRLFKVTAYVRRFIHNAKMSFARGERITGRLSRQELANAELDWVKSAQERLKQNEQLHRLTKQLNVVEEVGVLRCRGRLCNSELEAEAKKPILLPRHHRLTEMIVVECHRKLHHSGVRATLSQVRTKFWVPKGRQIVKKLISKCVTCKKFEGKPYAPAPVADLPDFRVNQAAPFSYVGVDFAGPLYYKVNTGTMEKAYIALFSCCVTRALHLELVEDLTAETFRRCLRRFTARRGVPQVIVSDNATTFQATEKAVTELFNHPEVQQYCDSHRIEWKFNLEKSPWWGGFFERMVRSIKRCLMKTLGEARLTFDELATVLVEVEGTLNDRPLTYVYDEVGEEVLTPSHFLYGRRVTCMPDEVNEPPDHHEIDHNARFRYLSAKLQHLWNRWHREYLTDLREHHASRSSQTDRRIVEVGDIVLVSEEDKKRNQWKVGVVEKLIRGRDKQVRGAHVRVVTNGKRSYLDRPVQR